MFYSYNIYLFAVIALAKLFNVNGKLCGEPTTMVKDSTYEFCGTLTPGTIITIDGTRTTDVFSINLKRGQQNIGLQITVKVNENKIVFNNMKDGKLDKEHFTKLPAGFDKIFLFKIICDDNAYEISLNGQFLLNYSYRHLLNQMTLFENTDDQKYIIQLERNDSCDSLKCPELPTTTPPTTTTTTTTKKTKKTSGAQCPSTLVNTSLTMIGLFIIYLLK